MNREPPPVVAVMLFPFSDCSVRTDRPLPCGFEENRQFWIVPRLEAMVPLEEKTQFSIEPL